MTAKDAVLELMARRDAMDIEINKIRAKLDEHGVGTSGPLVGEDGFPRNDVDIPAIRNLRSQLSCLENDMKEVYEEIRQGLTSALVPGRPQTSASEVDELETKGDGDIETQEDAFCFVASVTAGSPAEEAGLKERDQIVQFGRINANNHNALQSLAGELTKESVSIHLLRHGEHLTLQLRPRTGWGGNGSLGCRILPLVRLPSV